MSGLRFRSLWVAIGLAMVLTILMLSLLPGKVVPNVPTGDKINHFIAYSALMAWFSQLFPQRRVRVALGCLALGAVIEILQPIVSDRYFEGWDNVANAVGVAIGWLLMFTPARNSMEWADAKLR